METKGVGRRVPFLITRIFPVPPAVVPRSVTNKRPSGAKAIEVGLVNPPTIFDFVKPDGPASAVVVWRAKAARHSGERTRRISLSSASAPDRVSFRPRIRKK